MSISFRNLPIPTGASLDTYKDRRSGAKREKHCFKSLSLNLVLVLGRLIREAWSNTLPTNNSQSVWRQTNAQEITHDRGLAHFKTLIAEWKTQQSNDIELSHTRRRCELHMSPLGLGQVGTPKDPCVKQVTGEHVTLTPQPMNWKGKLGQPLGLET